MNDRGISPLSLCATPSKSGMSATRPNPRDTELCAAMDVGPTSDLKGMVVMSGRGPTTHKGERQVSCVGCGVCPLN